MTTGLHAEEPGMVDSYADTVRIRVLPESVLQEQPTICETPARSFDPYSTDLGALRRLLLDPLGPGGDREYRQAVYDKAADSALFPPASTAAANAVLLFDGVFLQREELLGSWELRILVSATFENTVRRSRARDQSPLMSADEAERRYRRRYMPSQRFYFEPVRPARLADVVVYNDEPSHPGWDTQGR